MELAKVSHLLKLADEVDSELDEKESGLRKSLDHVMTILRSAQQKLEKMVGHGCLDKKLMERLKYGVHRIEFYVNEIRITDPQGSSRKGYLRKLAKDVLRDVPTFTDPEKEGQGLVREVEPMIRKDEIDEIVDLLLSDDSNSSDPVSIIPILGMPGTGKTSLLRLVCNQEKVIKSHFKQMWVDIYPDQGAYEIVREVYYKASPFPKYEYASFSNAIYNLLKQEVEGSRCLLVLRDLSDDQDCRKMIRVLEILLVLFAVCKRGSKILVTSRSTFVEPLYLLELPIAKDAAYQLKPLHLNESLLVYFQSIAFGEIAIEDRNSHLSNIGLEILNKCASNIQAMMIIASILSSEPQSLEKWLYINILLARVENPVKYIRIAVDLMQKQNAFTDTWLLLAYSSLFPLDYKFSKLELQQLWEVQGLLIHPMPLLGKFNDHFEKLLMAEYFLVNIGVNKNGVTLCYTIQTLMHEVVKHLTSDNHRLLDKPSEEVGAQHVSFVVGSSWEAPSWLYDAKALKTLLFLPSESCRFITIPNLNNILSNLKSLQALDLAVVHFRSCPDSLGELKQLRYLRLSISFESLPKCITNLKYLSTLDLRHTAILTLPNSFHKLHSLKHLYTGGRLIDLPPRFEELIQLQTLDVFIIGENNGLGALEKLSNLTGKLKICYGKGREKDMWLDEKYQFDRVDGLASRIRQGIEHEGCNILLNNELDDLSLVWSPLYEEPAHDTEDDIEQDDYRMKFEFLLPPSSVISLAVQGWNGVNFPLRATARFSTLPDNLVSVHIADCHRCKHLPSLCSLPSLRSLQLRGLNALEWIETFEDFEKPHFSTKSYFPSLKFLMLANLPQLKGWSEFLEQQKIFSCLSEVRVSGCPNLMSMPLVPSLEKLLAFDIRDNLLKHLLGVHELPASSWSTSSVSPPLKELHISSIYGLESLLIAGTSLQALTVRECWEFTNVMLMESSNSIKQLKIRACPNLKDISSALQHLSILEKLEIDSCEEVYWMNDIDNDVTDIARAAKYGLNNLCSLTLKNISKPEPLPKGLGCLVTLQELSLCWLYDLSVFPESIGCLTKLTRLVIRCCPKLKKLPDSFPNLKSLIQLEIKECPKLERRYKLPNGKDSNLVEHIPNVHLG